MSDDDKKKAAIYEEIIKYRNAEYLKKLNLDVVKDLKVLEKLRNTNLLQWSIENRIIVNVRAMKYSYLLEKTNTIATCFKATYDGTSCIFGYLYSKHILSSKGSSSIAHKYVCCAPTYKSQDGEYRNRLIPWTQFNRAWDKYYNDVFEQIERMILSKIENNTLEFQVDFYYPINFAYSEHKFEESIDEARLPIKMFALCWFYDAFQIYWKIMANHINPAYQYVIYQAENEKLIKEILNKISEDEYWGIVSRISRFHRNIDAGHVAMTRLECGQKIFPLTTFEAIKLDNINFNVWREIYFTNMCSNIVLNLISPSFPFINNWFYIQNTHGGLFDNHSMHEKYKYSTIASDISEQLKNVDKFNYVDNAISKGPINSKFMRLSKYIQKSIVYVDSAIKLTELAICMTSEYVGRTLRDLPILLGNGPKDSPSLEYVFTKYPVFVKHVFEYIYGFYCMNTKAGLFHGDIHMNNATIFKLYEVHTATGELRMKNPSIVYIIGDTNYIFSHYGVYSMIIDYSRAIMGNYAKLKHEFGINFAEHYFREQRFRVLQILYHYFPKIIARHHDNIEALLISNFPLLFKILSAIDTFVMCSNLSALFTIDEAFVKGAIKPAPGIGKFLIKIIQVAEAGIVKNLIDAIEGKINSVDDIEWPNLLIIRQCFEDYTLNDNNVATKYADHTILDVFNYNNDIEFDVEDYSTCGPFLSIDKEISALKKHNLEPDPDMQEWIAFRNLNESTQIEHIVSKYEQQEKDLVDFESWMLL